MEQEKAELVDRLNAINQIIAEQGLAVDKKLLSLREKIKQELDLYSERKKDDKPRRNGLMSWFRRKTNRL
jgi:hypothetical protein